MLEIFLYIDGIIISYKGVRTHEIKKRFITAGLLEFKKIELVGRPFSFFIILKFWVFF